MKRRRLSRASRTVGLVAAGTILALAIGACSKTPEAPITPAPVDTAAPTQAPVTVPPPVSPIQAACSAVAPTTTPKTPYDAPPEQVIDEETTYTATMVTSCGTIVFELLSESAPQTVNNFVSLAQDGWFDGTLFHRISNSIDIIQGGDALCTPTPEACGTGSPGYSIPDELSGTETYDPGVLAMANAGPNTGGSQFFIVTGPKAAVLLPNYPIFGRVTEGLDVAQMIQQQPVSGETPIDLVWIESVTIQGS